MAAPPANDGGARGRSDAVVRVASRGGASPLIRAAARAPRGAAPQLMEMPQQLRWSPPAGSPSRAPPADDSSLEVGSVNTGVCSVATPARSLVVAANRQAVTTAAVLQRAPEPVAGRRSRGTRPRLMHARLAGTFPVYAGVATHGRLMTPLSGQNNV